MIRMEIWNDIHGGNSLPLCYELGLIVVFKLKRDIKNYPQQACTKRLQ